MLMNHKNFRFTQIPDKTNDMIFLKNLKTLFLGHFWLFLPGGEFFQNIWLSQVTIYGPVTPCSVSEKTKESILRKLPDTRKDRWMDGPLDGRTEGWTDGQTLQILRMDRPWPQLEGSNNM